MSATAYRGWNLGSTGIYQCLLWVGFGAKFETKVFICTLACCRMRRVYRVKSRTPAYVIEVMTEFTGVSA